MKRIVAAAASCLALVACTANGEKPKSASDAGSGKGPGLNKAFSHAPFTPTYRA